MSGRNSLHERFKRSYKRLVQPAIVDRKVCGAARNDDNRESRE